MKSPVIPEQMPIATPPLLYAHRGSMVLAPENTLPAFELALSYGADVLEIDVRLTRDKRVLVIHDECVERTCEGHGRVQDMTLSQLKKLDAGHRFTDLNGNLSQRQRNIRFLSLDELFEYLPNTPINIDIKDNSAQAAEAVANAIDKAQRHSTVNVGSFHPTALAQFRTIQPETTTAATQAEVAKLYFGRGGYKKLPFEYLQIPLRYRGIPLATRGFIRHATQRNIKTVYWTINDSGTMRHLIDRNVAGIVTDRIDIAARILGKPQIGS